MDDKTLQTLRDAIRDVPDFPKPGILFKDITPVLADPVLLRRAIDGMLDFVGDRKIDKVVGIDARGFIFGALMADRLNAGFIPARKRGKLPYRTRGVDYALEYGTASIEMHEDAIHPGERVLLADDLLATGGTAAAALELIQHTGAELISAVFFIELGFLNGRSRIAPLCPVHALVTY